MTYSTAVLHRARLITLPDLETVYEGDHFDDLLFRIDDAGHLHIVTTRDTDRRSYLHSGPFFIETEEDSEYL